MVVASGNGLSEKKRELVRRINENYLIYRKSSERLNEDGIPLTMTPEVRRFAYDIMNSKNISIPDTFLKNQNIDPHSIDEVTGWNLFWALEMAATMVFRSTSGGTYQRFLPARLLMYDLFSSYINQEAQGIGGKSVLELGCGSALTLTRLARQGANTTGLDSSIMALEFARYLADTYGVSSKITLMQKDYLDTKLKDEQFDVVENFGVYEHLKGDQPDRLIAETYRLLKNGGIAVIGVPNEQSPFYRRFKKKEQNTKNSYPGLVEIPVEHDRHDLSIQAIMERNSLIFIKNDGMLIAPSAPIKAVDIKDQDVEFFSEYLPRKRAGEPTPSIETVVGTWRGVEAASSRDIKRYYGWGVYYISQKR